MLRKADIRALTGIRGIAALIVVIYHIQFGLEDAPLHGFLRFDNGYLAVDLFFILSGFVMSLNYRSRFAAGVSWSDYAAFIGKRIRRLFPLYWCVCAFAVAKAIGKHSPTEAVDLSLGHLAANFLMIHSWGLQVERYVLPSWSVSTEFAAYFLFPLAVAILAPFRHWATAAALSAFALLLAVKHSGLGEAGTLDVFQIGSAYPMLRCFAGFILGMVAYELASTSWAARRLAGNRVLVALLVSTFLGVVCHLDILLAAVLFPLLIVNLALNQGLAERIFGNPPVHYLGLISYSLYLVHPLVMGGCVRLAHLLHEATGIPVEWLATATVVSITTALSALTYRYVEQGRWIEKASRMAAELYRSVLRLERQV